MSLGCSTTRLASTGLPGRQRLRKRRWVAPHTARDERAGDARHQARHLLRFATIAMPWRRGVREQHGIHCARCGPSSGRSPGADPRHARRHPCRAANRAHASATTSGFCPVRSCRWPADAIRRRPRGEGMSKYSGRCRVDARAPPLSQGKRSSIHRRDNSEFVTTRSAHTCSARPARRRAATGPHASYSPETRARVPATTRATCEHVGALRNEITACGRISCTARPSPSTFPKRPRGSCHTRGPGCRPLERALRT